MPIDPPSPQLTPGDGNDILSFCPLCEPEGLGAQGVPVYIPSTEPGPGTLLGVDTCLGESGKAVQLKREVGAKSDKQQSNAVFRLSLSNLVTNDRWLCLGPIFASSSLVSMQSAQLAQCDFN